MKIEEPRPMKEIREIRNRINEEIKDMTPAERRAYFMEKVKHFENKLGRKLPRVSKVKV
ncbi:MAG: hypothetical protein AB1798_12205 [Spirochaetota bacterium]